MARVDWRPPKNMKGGRSIGMRMHGELRRASVQADRTPSGASFGRRGYLHVAGSAQAGGRWAVAVGALCAFLCALAITSAPALAVRQHLLGASFGSAGAGEGQLSTPAGVAINESSGDIYVVDHGNNRVEYFSSSGAYEGQFDGSGSNLLVEGSAAPTGQLSEPRYIAIDNSPGSPSQGDVYVADNGHRVIDKFSATGHYIGQLKETSAGSPFSYLVGLAVDSNGSLWVYQGNSYVAQFSGAQVNEFLSSRELQFFGFAAPGFTVDSLDNFYAESSFYGPSKFDNSGKVVIQEFDSLLHEFFSVRIDVIGSDLSSNEIYIANADAEGSIGRFTSTGKFEEIFGSEQLGSESAGGIAIDAGNGDVLVTDSLGDKVDVYVPQPPSPPTIEAESASGVSSTSATLHAQIKPTGPDTTYYFQYGPESCTSTPSACTDLPAAPGLDIGEGFEGLSVSVLAKDLQAATTYHFRVVAINELGSTDGIEKTFITQATGMAFGLADGRMWEMVTPPNKQGAAIIAVGNEQGADIQAAEDGGGLTYGATSPITGSAAGSSTPEVIQVLSRRRAPGEWETAQVTPPHSTGAWTLAVGHSAEYKLFSNNLSLGFLEPADATPLPPLPSTAEKTVYLRHNNECSATPAEAVPATCYQALVSEANLPPGTKIGAYGSEGAGDIGFINATPDFSHIVLQSNYGVPLTGAPGDNGSSYVWSQGELTWVGGRVPGGSPHAISNDGTRVVGTELFGHAGLDLEDVSTKEVIQMDAGTPGYEEVAFSRGPYWTASSEDSRVFFKSNGDLYVFELTSARGAPLAGQAIDLSQPTNLSETAQVLGVAGASEDGASVYFVANGVLGNASEHGVKAGNCERGHEMFRESCNLYGEHFDGTSGTWGAPAYIGTLSGADFPDWNAGGRAHVTARVSPNGRYLAFMSERSLTGYENRDAESGVPDEEVFLYDAAAGKLLCASCNPTGAQPVGIHEGHSYEEHFVDYAEIWGNRWFAANIPGWDSMDLSLAVYQSRYLSDSGRLFFNSSDALVPGDVNGTEDVYEYEPAGVGTCQPPGYGQSASDVFVQSIGGCVALISAGTSSEESAFMEASATGGDVFFMTLSRLSQQDYDTSIDVYDAHECTEASPCAPVQAAVPPPCTSGDACKPAPSPQPALYGAPASETFTGTGNLAPAAEVPKSKACGRGKVRRKGRCAKRKGKARRNKRTKRPRRSKGRK